MKVYQVSGTFMLEQNYKSHPFDAQLFNVDLRPKKGEFPFIVQPMLRKRQFEVEGWENQDSYVSYERQLISIFDTKRLHSNIIPYFKSSFVWVAKRTATDPAKLVAPMGRRVALVIGNGAYANSTQLPNPPKDARAVARALRQIGFTVIEGVDLDRSGMDRTIVEFLRKAAQARVAIVFYAGHGVEIDGKNYLLPIDARSIERTTVSFELIDIDRIVAGLDDEARTNIIILDACRDNPLQSRTATRSAGRGGGLAGYSTVSSGMLIAFAADPGKTAIDGEGENSPFTTALIKHIGTPNLEINAMLTRVRADVFKATDGKQRPWTNSSLMGEVVLVNKTP